MGTGCGVVIDRWVGGSYPFTEVLAQIIPWKVGQAFVIHGDEVGR
jgi:hypothetical protein